METRILAVEQETPIDRTLRLSVPGDAHDVLAFTPGQFVVLHDPAAETPRRRAYSLSGWPGEDDHLKITVRDMGTLGHALYHARVGTHLAMRAPAGGFVLREAPGDDILMVAGGSGVTPFRAFVGSMRACGSTSRAALVQSARVPNELLFHETFAAWADVHPPFTYLPTVTRAEDDDPWPGARGRIGAEQVRAQVRDPGRTRFYACGPAAFVASMLTVAEELGIPADRRHKEQWG